ncbi:MAG: hypothetical protein AAFU64_06840 [Bacteroidota bacterium]
MKHELLNVKNWIFVLSLCLLFDFSIAQTFTTVRDGNWNDAATWDSGVPSPGSDVIINHNVLLNQTSILSNLEITNLGVFNLMKKVFI